MKCNTQQAAMFRCGWNDTQYGLTDPTARNASNTPHEWAQRLVTLANELLAAEHNNHYARGCRACAEAFLNGETVNRLEG
jgi:hypothetical protein